EDRPAGGARRFPRPDARDCGGVAAACGRRVDSDSPAPPPSRGGCRGRLPDRAGHALTAREQGNEDAGSAGANQNWQAPAAARRFMSRSSAPHVLIVGSVALDSVRTPAGAVEEALGGAAVYSSIAASFFAPVRLVGVIGRDFPAAHLN